MNEHSGRQTSYSCVTLSRIMTAVDVNLYGTVHGGVIVTFIDTVAGAVAARHTGGTAQVNWTGTTSLEVGCRVVAERAAILESRNGATE
jgi:acyl-CoA hydrolase